MASTMCGLLILICILHFDGMKAVTNDDSVMSIMYGSREMGDIKRPMIEVSRNFVPGCKRNNGLVERSYQ